MYLQDFIYNGIKLSDLGFVIGSLTTSIEDNSDIGSHINFETIMNKSININEIINSTYEDTITCTFDIIRTTLCNSGGFNEHLNDNEISFVMSWLNSRQYQKFIPIYNKEITNRPDYIDTYFYGTFNEIQVIKMNGNVVGFTIQFQANAPYGFKEVKKIIKTITASNESFDIYNKSDEIGILYPKNFQITIGEENIENVEIRIKNYCGSQEVFDTKISKCNSGETITLDCIHKVITSNLSHTTLYNDFNYVFPKLLQNFNITNGTKNTISANIPCTIEIEYEPIRKAGIIV